jgi:hypothetical protein
MSDDARPTEERLDELEEHIQQAHDHAAEALGEPPPGERRYYESGTEGDELDDQQIAPPG